MAEPSPNQILAARERQRIAAGRMSPADEIAVIELAQLLDQLNPEEDQ